MTSYYRIGSDIGPEGPFISCYSIRRMWCYKRPTAASSAIIFLLDRMICRARRALYMMVFYRKDVVLVAAVGRL